MATIIDYAKLMNDLKKWTSSPSIWYEYNNYWESYMALTYDFGIESIAPFTMKHPISKKEIVVSMNIIFSRDKGYISINPDNKIKWEVDIDVSREKIKYQLKYPFENFITNNDEFAVIIETESSFDFELILYYLGITVSKNGKATNYLLSRFRSAFSQAEKSPEKLDWLYENALSQAISDRGDDTLWNDLQTLTKFDNSKWFVDTGSAIINVLQGFSDLKVAYDYFKDYPKITFEIYNTISDYEKKLSFCQFLIGVNLVFSPDLTKTKANFINGKGYSFDLSTHVINESKSFSITNKLFVRTKVTPMVSNRYRYYDKEDVHQNIESLELSPMDLVTINDSEVKSQTKSKIKTLPVPALYVYYLAEKQQHDNLMQALRISLDFVAIVIGIASWGTASGLSAAIIALDIGLATTDLLLMNDEVKEFLNQYEGGAWFVENWDVIYAVVGLGMITYALVRGIIEHGPKLIEALKNVKNIGSKNRIFIRQLEDLIKKMELYEAKNNVALQEVLVAAKPRSASLMKKFLKLAFATTDEFAEFVAKNLANKGISLRKTKDGLYEVLYKGIVVESGTEQKVGAFLQKIYRDGPRKVARVLRKLFERHSISESFVKLYRVQGGKMPNASRFRLFLRGKKAFIEGNERLYVTFKDEDRVLEFWTIRGESAEVFTAEVSESFFNKLMKDAVKQSRGKEFPNRPQFGDASKTKYSLGIPKNYFDELSRNMKNVEILKFK